VFRASAGRRLTHRTISIAGGVLGVLAIVAGMSSPALAQDGLNGPTGGNASAGNQLIVLGGSQATFRMVASLAAIFNQSPGCDLSSSTSIGQPLDFGCPGVNGETGGAQPTYGEDGLTPYATENPFNDVILEEPALGSSNGIAQLEDEGAHGSSTFSGVAVVSGSTTITISSGTFNGAQAKDTITDSGGYIPAGDTVSSINTADTQITLAVAATNSDSTDQVTTSAPVNVSPLSAATSSRAPNLTSGSSAGDDKGLNFVAYAMDGVSWFHWTAAPPVSGTSASAPDTVNNTTTPATTPSAGVKSLTVAQLTSIYTNSLSCNVNGATVTMNWECLPGGTPGPIALYIAQSGAGTESTWASMLGLACGTSCVFPYGGENTAHTIFENETGQIFANGDEADAIFFFSYGNFTANCQPTQGYCDSKPTGLQSGSAVALGEIAGIPVTPATIAAQLPSATCTTVNDVSMTSASIALKTTSSFPASVLDDSVVDETTPAAIPAGTLVKKWKSATKVKLSNAATANDSSDTLKFCPSLFAGDRLLYNVYSDGSNPDIPVASDATLNAVSEDGFLCKASTDTDIDPNTGLTYLSEIQSAITSQGFFPLYPAGSPQVEDGNGSASSPYTTTATGIPNPAWNELSGSKYDASVEAAAPYSFPTGDQDTDGSAVASPASAANPVGYCLVLTTDGNSKD
jgi:hypothetical protein